MARKLDHFDMHNTRIEPGQKWVWVTAFLTRLCEGDGERCALYISFNI